MGTFHQDHGALHGITVVVDTNGDDIYIGRCHEESPEGILLLDADRHVAGAGGKSKEEFLRQAARVGVWKRLDRVTVPQAEIRSVRRLQEIAQELTANESHTRESPKHSGR